MEGIRRIGLRREGIRVRGFGGWNGDYFKYT